MESAMKYFAFLQSFFFLVTEMWESTVCSRPRASIHTWTLIRRQCGFKCLVDKHVRRQIPCFELFGITLANCYLINVLLSYFVSQPLVFQRNRYSRKHSTMVECNFFASNNFHFYATTKELPKSFWPRLIVQLTNSFHILFETKKQENS